MKKIFAMTIAVVLGFSGMAFAGEPQGQASGKGCNGTIAGPQDNPGKLFQALKELPGFTEGLNPKQIAEAAGDIPSDKVSEIIQTFCDNSPS
ncbi:hypothetical protein [Sulfitobacter sp. HGT1]|uniref:hypothetical protein n=1 Tax=Sulfitobacter sp. HGT1 TaxID=2735435 RepID=UPI001593C5E3|nr:hypothetical protein [Sulfitobacter sp. HGT1]